MGPGLRYGDSSPFGDSSLFIPIYSCESVIIIKSNYFWPPKKAGIFEFLEFLKVVAYDSTIGPHDIHIY